MLFLLRKIRLIIILGIIAVILALIAWYISAEAGRSEIPPDKSVFVLQKHFVRGRILN
jgi:hypothetical protein